MGVTCAWMSSASRVARTTVGVCWHSGRSPPAMSMRRLFRRIGIVGPLTRPEIGEVLPDGAAAAAGLRKGDLVLQRRRRPPWSTDSNCAT